MASNYDNSAWFYDSLSRLVFGWALINAQVYLLKYIPPNTHILIAGGGTGWILEEITRIHPAGLHITYVEISAKMLARSKKRNYAENSVNFINQPVERIDTNHQFDIILTAFLFDNFSAKTTQKVFGHLTPLLKKEGLWLNTDFQLTGKWWQNVLTRSMLLFFKVLCKIESRVLPDIEKSFEINGYKATHHKTFFNGFISSNVYQR